MGGGFFTDAAGAEGGVAGVEQGLDIRTLQEFQGADLYCAVCLPPVGHGIEAGAAKGCRGFYARERGAGDVDGGRHNVAAVEHVFHHGPVQSSRIAAGPLVFSGNLLVHRREQRARAAGKVGNAQFPDGLSIRPVHALQLGDSQPRQQRRRRG